MTTIVTTMIPGEVTFFDANGVPLNGGTVTFYLQGTTTPKNTWSDFQGTILNTNPVVLDSGGRANIWGNGLYRQIVKDSLGNTIWDQNVFAGDISSSLDVLGSTQGDVLYRGASTWTVLAPSTAGLALVTKGASANPVWAQSTGAFINVQYFNTSGTFTYTPDAGTNSVIAEVYGAGGGGGGAALTAGGQSSLGGAGGAGGYARKLITSAFSGVTVTVGNAGAGGVAGNNAGGTGGTSSFGAIISATGGSAGSGGPATSGVGVAVGGAGGTGSSGDINLTGIPGQAGIINSAGTIQFGGQGGWTPYSPGATGQLFTVGGSAAGNNASGKGGGGGGGCNGASQSAVAGGNGAGGIVIVWEYA